MKSLYAYGVLWGVILGFAAGLPIAGLIGVREMKQAGLLRVESYSPQGLLDMPMEELAMLEVR